MPRITRDSYDVRLPMVPGNARGYCDSHNQIIVVEETHAPNAQVRVLILWQKSLIPSP